MKRKIMAGAIFVLCFVVGTSAYAVEQKSVGNGNVIGFVQIFSEDISFLEKEIYNLMSECGKEMER